MYSRTARSCGTRTADPAPKLAEINEVAGSTGNDPGRGHGDPAAAHQNRLPPQWRTDPSSPSPRYRPMPDLPAGQSETIRWQPVFSPPPRAAHRTRHAPHRPTSALVNGTPTTTADTPTYGSGSAANCRGGHSTDSIRWLLHTTVTWAERYVGYAVARAFAGHSDSAGDEEPPLRLAAPPRRNRHRGRSPHHRRTRRSGMDAQHGSLRPRGLPTIGTLPEASEVPSPVRVSPPAPTTNQGAV